MRSLAVAVTLAFLVAMGSSSATFGRLSMTIIGVDEEANLVVWEPDPAAEFYEIYRGSTFHHTVKLAETTAPVYLDDAPTPDEAWYIVRAIMRDGSAGQAGSCIERSGTTGVSVTTSSCV